MRLAIFILGSLSLLGCDRLLPSDDPPPAAVAPVAPPTVVLRTNAPSDLALFVDGREAGALTDGRGLQLSPGVHVLEGRRGAEVAVRIERSLAPGEAAEIALNVPEPAPPIAPPPEARPEPLGPRSAQVTLGEPVRGSGEGPSEADVTRALRARIRSIQACYERILASDPGAAGTVEVRFTVQPTGTVAAVESQGTASPPLAACATSAVHRLRFARSAAAAVYDVPLTFVAPAAPAAPAASGAAAPAHATPTRADVVAAMNAATPAVRACGRGQSGMVVARFTFRGADGAVQDVTVTGGSAPDEVRRCVEEAARRARLAPFANDTFSVNYPFRF